MSFAIPARLRPRSLRARLTFWYLLMLGGALSALGAFEIFVHAGTLRRELDAKLSIQANQFAGDRLPVLLGLDPALGLAADPRASAAPVVVRRPSGEALFRSAAFPDLGWAGEGGAAEAARRPAPFVTVSDRAGDPVRIATVVVERPGAEALSVQVAASMASVRSALARFALGTALFILGVVGVASYGGGFIARRALAPVDHIVGRVRAIQATRLDDRLDLRPDSDELARLVATLNQMLDRMEASMRSARRFAADASHELQTPLAAMRGAVEMCLRTAPRGAEHRTMAEDLLVEIEGLSALIRDLRLLALAEAGQLVERSEPLDLAALAGECCEIASALAEARGIRVETLVFGHPVVRGNPSHLHRVVLNLLQNAIRYSHEGAEIVASVGRAGDKAMLSVVDHGCGIAPADLPHIFEPFYRADPARARDTGGTGLGLAIAEHIVRLHGGCLKAASTPLRGTTLVVYLPLVAFSPAAPPSRRTPAGRPRTAAALPN